MRSGQTQRLAWGCCCIAVVSLAAGAIWGRQGAVAAATFGAVAAGIQLLVARMMLRTGSAGSVDRVKLYAVGVAVRFVGVVILGVMVSVDRTKFPPLPSALGYLGTVLPLLYLETRLSR